MKCKYLQDKFKIIEECLSKATEASTSDPHLAYMLSSYLAVLISGIYEDCVEYLFVQRAEKNNDSELKNLVEELIGRQFRNPKFDRIAEILGLLNPSYSSQIKSTVSDKSKMAIDSIVENKNKVAHGEVSNATLNDITGYHYSSVEIFELLEKILVP